jgi:hypothetical protein
MTSPGFIPLGIEGDIVEERGRWVVSLVTIAWTAEGDEQPFKRTKTRIRDYATRAEAELSCRWMLRAASRDQPFPRQGF